MPVLPAHNTTGQAVTLVIYWPDSWTPCHCYRGTIGTVALCPWYRWALVPLCLNPESVCRHTQPCQVTSLVTILYKFYVNFCTKISFEATVSKQFIMLLIISPNARRLDLVQPVSVKTPLYRF